MNRLLFNIKAVNFNSFETAKKISDLSKEIFKYIEGIYSLRNEIVNHRYMMNDPDVKKRMLKYHKIIKQDRHMIKKITSMIKQLLKTNYEAQIKLINNT